MKRIIRGGVGPALGALLATLSAGGAAYGQATGSAPVSTHVGSYESTVSGQPLTLPQGPAQVTVSRTLIPPGGSIPPHRHPYPRYNYVLDGGVRVTNLDTGSVQEFRAGQFIVETVGQWHSGEALDGRSAELLAIDQTPPGRSNMERRP